MVHRRMCRHKQKGMGYLADEKRGTQSQKSLKNENLFISFVYNLNKFCLEICIVSDKTPIEHRTYVLQSMAHRLDDQHDFHQILFSRNSDPTKNLYDARTMAS